MRETMAAKEGVQLSPGILGFNVYTPFTLTPTHTYYLRALQLCRVFI